MGRGVLATSDIEDGAEVLVVPDKLIMSRNHLSTSSDQLHVKIAEALSADEDAVAGVLLLEQSRGKDSLFYEYMQVLPTYIPNLSHYNSKSLAQLQSPAIVREVQYEQNRARSNYNNFIKALRKIWPGGKKALPSWEQYQWALSVIDSRGLRFHGKVGTSIYILYILTGLLIVSFLNTRFCVLHSWFF